MYFVKYGEQYLHDPRTDEYKLFDLSLDCEENSCGFCDFTIYPNHPLYNKLKPRDAKNQIEVYDGDELLFAGFIYELGKEFHLDGHVKCKGELAYLQESIVRTYSSQYILGYSEFVPDTLSKLFRWYIENHNKQVDEYRRFQVGNIDESTFDKAKDLWFSSDKFATTWEELNDKLLNEDSSGGYLMVRHENGTRYLDYVYDYSDVNAQVLDFGVNLTNYSQTDDCSEMATFIIPTGAKMSETRYAQHTESANGPYYSYFPTSDTEIITGKQYYYLDYTQEETDDPAYNGMIKHMIFLPYNGQPISNIIRINNEGPYFNTNVLLPLYERDDDCIYENQPLTITLDPDGPYYEYGRDFIKKGAMIYSKFAVEKYGWIGCTYSDTSLKTRSELIKEGMKVLKEKIAPKRTIEIKAVDMHLINPDLKPIRIGEYIRVRSKPHDLDEYFICRSINLNLNDPSNSEYVLGMTIDTYTSMNKKTVNVLNTTINNQISDTTKPISKITAERSNGQITSVVMSYEDGSSKTYSYQFNSSGDVVKFGDIPIDWS